MTGTCVINCMIASTLDATVYFMIYPLRVGNILTELATVLTITSDNLDVSGLILPRKYYLNNILVKWFGKQVNKFIKFGERCICSAGMVNRYNSSAWPPLEHS